MKKAAFYTLGCRVNQYESVALAEKLLSLGYELVDFSEAADLYIVNTCAVTAESMRKSLQVARRAAARGAKVALLGCAVQLAPQKFADIDGVCFLTGCGSKGELVDFVRSGLAGKSMCVNDSVPAEFERLEIGACPTELFSTCRAYIKIQDGCSCRCSYCTIPFARGASRSRPACDIVAEAERLAAIGYKELELTGIEVSAYSELPLGELISRVGAISGIRRIRLGSLSPLCIDEKFIAAVSNESKFMPHLHISVQSGSGRVLKAMRRPYTAERLEKILDTIKTELPSFCLSADLICGFPGESEEDFEQTKKLVEKYRFSHIHAFPYSERAGTEAAGMKDMLPVALRRRRNEELIALSDSIRAELLAERVGGRAEVLVEKTAGKNAVGHTADYFECRFERQSETRVGDIVKVDIMSHKDAALVGREV